MIPPTSDILRSFTEILQGLLDVAFGSGPFERVVSYWSEGHQQGGLFLSSWIRFPLSALPFTAPPIPGRVQCHLMKRPKKELDLGRRKLVFTQCLFQSWDFPVCAKLLLSCLTLCDSMDCSLSGSLSMIFPRQKYWRGWSFPSPGDLPDWGIKPMSLVSPALARGFFTSQPLGKPLLPCRWWQWKADVPGADAAGGFTCWQQFLQSVFEYLYNKRFGS